MRYGTHKGQDALWIVRKAGGRVDFDGIHAGPWDFHRAEITLDEKIGAIRM